MAKKTTIIYDVYTAQRTSSRDAEVKSMILQYMSANMATMADGIVNNVPVLSGQMRDRFARPYQIGDKEWNIVTKSPEYTNMAKLSSNLKLGLICSFYDTHDTIFLDFLLILIYSAKINKYYPKGFNKHVMQYTIDNADARTDFKKYGSLIVTLRKKCETFLQLFEHKLKRGLDDTLIREILQSLETRINDMVKNLRRKLQTHMDDPDLKIMMSYSTSQDGKQLINALGVMETIRERSINNLAYPSNKVLTACGMDSHNVRAMLYRSLFNESIESHFGELTNISNMIFDEWMRRNSENITIKEFRTGFVRSMKQARNMGDIKKEIDELLFRMLEDKSYANRINKIDARNYLYDYLVKNIFLCGLEIVH